MENTKYGRRREGRWTPIRAKAQDTRANPNSWKTHLVRKRWDIGLLRAFNPRIMMMRRQQLAKLDLTVIASNFPNNYYFKFSVTVHNLGLGATLDQERTFAPQPYIH